MPDRLLCAIARCWSACPLAGPLSTIASATAVNALALALMHLAVAAVLIPGLAATYPARPG